MTVDPWTANIAEPEISREMRDRPLVGEPSKEFADFIWGGPLDLSGYGSATRGYVKALFEHSQYKMTVRNLSSSSALSLYEEMEDDVKLWGDMLRDVRATTDAAMIFHCVPALFNNRIFRKNIGYTVYESDSLPPIRRIPCNTMNEIWVPCKFNESTFRAAGVSVPIRVIPHVVDLSLYDPTIEPLQFIGTEDKYVFMSMGDYHWRKGWDVLLQAFWKEFDEKDDVVLLIKPFSGDDSEQNQNRLKSMITRTKQIHGYDKKKTAKIIFFGDFVKPEIIQRLYATADCFVSATRGEAWGLHLTEALSMEIPVIATNWSGQTQFLNDSNSYLINVNRLVPVEDPNMLQVEPGYYKHKMAEPDIDHLCALMRHVYENQQEAKDKAIYGREDLGQRFSPKIIAGMIDSALEQIL